MLIVLVHSRLSGFQTDLYRNRRKRNGFGFRRVFDKLWLEVALPECLSFVNHVALMTTSCFVFVWHLFPKTTRSVSGLNKEE